MDIDKPKNSKLAIRLPLLISLAVATGILIGATVFNQHNSTFNDIQGSSDKFKTILSYIEHDYVDSVDIEGLADHAITEMLAKLDPHTAYIPKRDVQMAQTHLEGDFEGIGIEFNIIKDTLIVVAPISGGPSEAVGIRAGDKIVKVDGKTIAGVNISNRDVFDLLRGKKGTKVNLAIKRRHKSQLLEFTVTRDMIPTYSVDVSYMIDHATGYIKISRFAEKTYEEFRQALLELKSKGMKQLIIDLRDNPGGYMDKAVYIADELIPGNNVIVSTKGKQSSYDRAYYASMKGIFETGPLVILIDEGSASASEIVSGALQDNDRALIVGRRSFGKGLVQVPIDLEDGSELRLTVSRYYTPSGRSIQKPYDGDIEDYHQELVKRYEHGEFFHADSIQFNDSLKYKTLEKKRAVYGGGGIMPDIFIPRDTSQYSNYLGELYANGIIREFAINYFNDHRKSIESMTLDQFKNSYEIKDADLNQLNSVAKAAGIKFSEADFKRSKHVIQSNIKALVARGQWGNEGYYAVISQDDDILQQALKHMDKARKLEK